MDKHDWDTAFGKELKARVTARLEKHTASLRIKRTDPLDTEFLRGQIRDLEWILSLERQDD